MASYEYNPAEVSLQINAEAAGLGLIVVDGFAEGSMIRVSRDEAMFGLKASGDGKVNTFSKRNNRNGVIAFTLEEAAPANAALDELLRLDETSSTGVIAVQMKDASGLDQANSPIARLVQRPDMDKGTEAGTREYMIACTELDQRARGGVQL
jgi:hypothetical protein